MHAKQQSANYETNIDRTKRKNIFTKIIGNFVVPYLQIKHLEKDQ